MVTAGFKGENGSAPQPPPPKLPPPKKQEKDAELSHIY